MTFSLGVGGGLVGVRVSREVLVWQEEPVKEQQGVPSTQTRPHRTSVSAAKSACLSPKEALAPGQACRMPAQK